MLNFEELVDYIDEREVTIFDFAFFVDMVSDDDEIIDLTRKRKIYPNTLDIRLSIVEFFERPIIKQMIGYGHKYKQEAIFEFEVEEVPEGHDYDHFRINFYFFSENENGHFENGLQMTYNPYTKIFEFERFLHEGDDEVSCIILEYFKQD